jgi:molybdopterin-guanine dinucleotide biosynthesis protein A
LDAPFAVAAAGGRMQPLLGRYSSSLLDALEAQLVTAAPMREVARTLGARVLTEAELEPFGDPARLCLNINTPGELAAAEG